MAERNGTYALLVGVERYDASERWSLDGPATDVRRMTNWLVDSGVARDHIRVLLSTLDRNAVVRNEIGDLLGAEPGGTSSEDVRRELVALRHASADLFLFYWGGHGWATTRGERCLFCSDATLQAFEHLDLASLMDSMKTDWYSGFRRQVFLVDACANFAPYSGSRPPRYDFGGGKPLNAIEQFALFAAKPGEASRNLDELKTGLFSNKFFEALGAPSKVGPWPPNFPAIGSQLKDHFNILKKEGQANQTPSQFWFRDFATNDEGFFGTSPLTELQEILAEAVARDRQIIPLARAWYVRALRHLPTATDRDRDAGERSISEMLSALDDWKQQPRGDLPLLSFAEGLAEKALPDAARQRVKELAARRARERGLDDAKIDLARTRLREELERVPDALQVFLVPERGDLSADDPQNTFEVSLFIWLGTSDVGQGGRISYGQRTGQTLAQAQEYVNGRLVTDLANSPPASIEFFVPYRLMCCEVDQWPYKEDDTMSFASLLGSEFPVVVRSYDRMLKPALREKSKQRWPFGTGSTAPDDSVPLRWLDQLQQNEEQIYKMLRSGARAPCLVLCVPVGPDAYHIWRASVWAGVSIGVWLRSGIQPSPDAWAQLYELLVGHPTSETADADALNRATHAFPIELPLEALRGLPRRVYDARQKDQNLFPFLTLCWDDPNRLPPVGWQVSPKTV